MHPVEACTAASWTPAGTLIQKVPDGSVFTYLSAAGTTDGFSYTGMVAPYGDAGPAREVPIVVGRLRAGLAQPPVSPTAAYPRMVALRDGRLRLFWSEPDDTAHGWSKPFLRTMKSIWYASYSPEGGWTEPAELVRDSVGIDWGQLGGSLFQTPDGDVHLTVSSGSVVAGRIVHAVVPRRGKPRVRYFPIDGIPSPFTALEERGDTLLVAFSVYRLPDPKAPLAVARVQLAQSRNGGGTWTPLDTPVLSALPDARTLNFAPTSDGQFHLMVGRTSPASSFVDRYTHLSSPDGGRTWSVRAEMPVPFAVQEPHLVGDGCGRLHFVFRDTNSRWSKLLYSRWTDGMWSEPVEVVPGMEVYSLVLSRGDSGLDLIYSTVTSDTTVEVARVRLQPK